MTTPYIDVDTRMLRAYLEGLPHRLEKKVESAIDVLGMTAEQFMREEAPAKTGFLRSSIVRLREGKTIRVVPLAGYAIYVEKGTRPHMIMPRSRRVLHWVSSTGEDVFAMRVRHPGTRPNPFIQRSQERLMRIIEFIMDMAVWEAIQP